MRAHQYTGRSRFSANFPVNRPVFSFKKGYGYMSNLHLSHSSSRRGSEDARQYAYRVLKSGILSLDFLPGQKMNEIDIASSLDISRTPVHDTFFRLSRENLTDLIPQRGAFVSKIDAQRIEGALWLHLKLGTSMIHSMHLNRISEAQLHVFYHILRQQQACLSRGDHPQVAQLMTDFYHQFYLFGGQFQHLWSALQKTDLDLRRLLYLSVRDFHTAQQLIGELTELTDALKSRDNDAACQIYRSHLGAVLEHLNQLEHSHPEYFTQFQEQNIS